MKKAAAEQERKAKIMADNAVSNANSVMAAAELKAKKAEKAQKSAELAVKNQKRLIRERAESLNENFRLKWEKLIIVLSIYSILSTVFMICKSDRCIKDIATAGSFIKRLFIGIFQRISNLADGASGIGNGIIQYLVGGLVAVLLIGSSAMVLYFGGKALINCYKRHCMDMVSLVVFLGCIVVLTGFAELMTVNIVLLLIGSQVVYIFVRQRIDKIKLNR